MPALLFIACLTQLPGNELEPLPTALAKVVPGVRFDDVPLRRAVNRVADANGAAVMFVRGVDPTTPVSLDEADLTAAEALADVVGQGNAAAVALGGAVYVAPPAVCANALKIAAERREELGPTRGVRREPRERALAEQNVVWGDLTPPRAILDDVAAQFGLAVENADAVPHDLWPAGRLPAADAPAALAAILAPFNLTFVWSDDRTGVTIEPLADGFSPDPAPPLTAFAARLPGDGAAMGEGGGVPLDRRTFTLAVEGASVRRIMEAVNGVRFEYDPRALGGEEGGLETRVSIDVTDADADTFFTALFEPAGIAFRWEGTTVTLEPAS
ncbi:hypothetical protein [Alienimonas chondri]|uniref:DUF2066 domain-containing protein n=1 Tax=Alienimonas chondri TaxID=2681879 RepID=A0ABX1V9K3_9PLAN|nr:hypothetical protein [Alienimonas chondri]NNJ24675.1 hypothetical protein [Alienimonas chondri]